MGEITGMWFDECARIDPRVLDALKRKDLPPGFVIYAASGSSAQWLPAAWERLQAYGSVMISIDDLNKAWLILDQKDLDYSAPFNPADFAPQLSLEARREKPAHDRHWYKRFQRGKYK